MNPCFSIPVPLPYTISRWFATRDRRYEWSIDPDTGLWVPIRDGEGFGHHRGTDFECPVGTVVSAMADGVIVRSRFENHADVREGAGLFILQLVSLPGFDSWVLKYSHLKAVYVKPGQKVSRHTPIAESGQTGAVASGPSYLHVDLQDLRHQWRAVQLDQ